MTTPLQSSPTLFSFNQKIPKRRTGEGSPPLYNPKMASRLAIVKRTGLDSSSLLGLRRWLHASSLPPPLNASISQPTASQPLVLPESDQIPDRNSNIDIGFGFGFPSFHFGGSVELMAVPKKKVRIFFLKKRRW